MSHKEYDYCFKILVIGDQFVGKTAIMQRFCDDVFSPVYMSTLGLDFKARNVEIGGKKIKIQIWDTAGQERFNTLISAYYRGASGILLVYDISNIQSFERVTHWMENIQKYAKSDVEIALLANKIDLAHKRMLTTMDGENLAKRNGIPYLETSAKSNTNIEKAFFDMTQTILSKMPNVHITSPLEKDVVLRPSKSNDSQKKRRC